MSLRMDFLAESCFQKLFQTVNFLSTWTTSIQLARNLSFLREKLHISCQWSVTLTNLLSTRKKIPHYSRVLCEKNGALYIACLVSRRLSTRKSLAAKLFLFVPIAYAFRFRLFCRDDAIKIWTNWWPLLWDMVYWTEKEDIASFISLSKWINRLKVHSNYSVSVLKPHLFVYYGNLTATSRNFILPGLIFFRTLTFLNWGCCLSMSALVCFVVSNNNKTSFVVTL